jgi:hypothetical protein
MYLAACCAGSAMVAASLNAASNFGLQYWLLLLPEPQTRRSSWFLACGKSAPQPSRLMLYLPAGRSWRNVGKSEHEMSNEV